MYRVYICELLEDDECISTNYILADNIDNAIDKFKVELIDLFGIQKFYDMVDRFESYYDESIDSKCPPEITFIDLGSYKEVDIEYLNGKLKELENSEEYKFTSEVSDIVKELVLYNKYYTNFRKIML